MSKNVAVDLDGTLLDYHGWVHSRHFDPPVPGALEFVKTLIARGHRVTVFTARSNHAAVRSYLLSQGFPDLPVTSEKFGFDMLLDDRAVAFPGPRFFNNTDEAVTAIEQFKPWWNDDLPSA